MPNINYINILCCFKVGRFNRISTINDNMAIWGNVYIMNDEFLSASRDSFKNNCFQIQSIFNIIICVFNETLLFTMYFYRHIVFHIQIGNNCINTM